MNSFFEIIEGTPRFPRRVYARLDDLEPIAPTGEDGFTFIFDAVDADWAEFELGGAFDLKSSETLSRMRQFWEGRFSGRNDDGPDIYEKVPLYRVEFDVPRTHPWFNDIPQSEDPWVTLQLTDEATDLAADVYPGLFAPATKAYLQASPLKAAPSEALNALFDMKNWPDASAADLNAALQSPCNVEALVCFDIGQGLASALICQCGVPTLYFDVGCGSTRNAPTTPTTIKFCVCSEPTIVLSHWDTDHWAGALKDKALLKRTWVVPRQSISSSHKTFGNSILKAGGKILVVGYGAPPITTFGFQRYDLRRCSGTGRNGSGLAMVVTDGATKRSWILTGDAGYHLLTQPMPTDIAAMVVPHHGADMGSSSIPPKRPSTPYGKLLYSFGPGNAHGPKKPPVRHPVAAAINIHASRGWSHGNWSSASPGMNRARSDVLATAIHPTTHLGGVGATWFGGIPLGIALLPCSEMMPITQW